MPLKLWKGSFGFSHGVNYCLDYDTSETYMLKLSDGYAVNYCLIYSTSETDEVRLAAGEVNYYLNYGTSETEAE